MAQYIVEINEEEEKEKQEPKQSKKKTTRNALLVMRCDEMVVSIISKEIIFTADNNNRKYFLFASVLNSVNVTDKYFYIERKKKERKVFAFCLLPSKINARKPTIFLC